MSKADRMTNGANIPFHPASHYDSPAAVLGDASLSGAEKRMILSCWASDMYAAESNPTLREIPGIRQPMRLADILGALRKLDGGEDDPPPRGGAAMRSTAFKSLNAVARRPISDAAPSRSRLPERSRWTREANVQRYRRLLATELSERERQFVERRLVEELQGTDCASAA